TKLLTICVKDTYEIGFELICLHNFRTGEIIFKYMHRCKMWSKYERLSDELDEDFSLKERRSNRIAEISDNEDQTISSILLNQPAKKKRKIFHHKLIKCFYFLLFIIFIFLIYFVFGMEKSLLSSIKKISSFVEQNFKNKNKNDWSLSIDSFGTESCIRVYDIDEDGLDDLIFGLVGIEEINRIGNNTNQNEGLLMAIRGSDGKGLWNISTKSEIFEINCLIDLDSDGRLDCIGSGRKHTLIGFDPHTGKIFWDQSFMLNLNDNWNIYNPVILPVDYDQDGIKEFLISTGGNPAIPSNVHDRESGRIVLLSGINGQQIGKDLILPEQKETYMSPILHSVNQQHYLLFGTGGETVPGSLYAQSLTNFYNFIIGNISHHEPDPFLDKFIQVPNLNGFYSIYTSTSKGVMVPPVLADVTNDGIKDILILSFDGEVLMLNGLNFEKLWSIKFECHETYTTPSPGFFDDDDILDFMLIQNLGTFDYYLNSSVVILSGVDGSILWKMNTGRMQMISPLTIQTDSHFRDIFFFRVQGIEEFGNSMHQVYHGIEPQQPVDRSPNNGKRSSNEFEKCQSLVERNVSSNSLEPRCGNDKNSLYLSSYGFVVDRSSQENPILVFKSEPEEKMLNLTLNQKFIELCLVMEPMERNTGAIGHFSSKRDLDLITIVTRGANVRDPDSGNYIKIVTDMKGHMLESEIYKNLIVKKLDYDKKSEIHISDLKFLQNQSWNAYMGTYANNVESL
ncbi:ITFG3-like isoform X1, partial [Brachionus plicatilis]